MKRHDAERGRALKERVVRIFGILTDREGERGAARWFAKKCGKHEATVGRWFRGAFPDPTALSLLKELEKRSALIVKQRAGKEVDALLAAQGGPSTIPAAGQD